MGACVSPQAIKNRSGSGRRLARSSRSQIAPAKTPSLHKKSKHRLAQGDTQKLGRGSVRSSAATMWCRALPKLASKAAVVSSACAFVPRLFPSAGRRSWHFVAAFAGLARSAGLCVLHLKRDGVLCRRRVGGRGPRRGRVSERGRGPGVAQAPVEHARAGVDGGHGRARAGARPPDRDHGGALRGQDDGHVEAEPAADEHGLRRLRRAGAGDADDHGRGVARVVQPRGDRRLGDGAAAGADGVGGLLRGDRDQGEPTPGEPRRAPLRPGHDGRLGVRRQRRVRRGLGGERLDDPPAAGPALRGRRPPRDGGHRRRGLLHPREQQGAHGDDGRGHVARRQAESRVGRPQQPPHHRERRRLRGEDAADGGGRLRVPRRPGAPREAALVDRRVRGHVGRRRRRADPVRASGRDSTSLQRGCGFEATGREGRMARVGVAPRDDRSSKT